MCSRANVQRIRRITAAACGAATHTHTHTHTHTYGAPAHRHTPETPASSSSRFLRAAPHSLLSALVFVELEQALRCFNTIRKEHSAPFVEFIIIYGTVVIRAGVISTA